MTLWVSQSASNSHLRLKRSVDSESTPENTSRMMHKNISSFCHTINYMGH
jgi:hypothetical protein